MTLVDPDKLKEIVKDEIGTSASHSFIASVYQILDAENKDHVSMKEACIKIEKMVKLFIGAGKAQALGKRFEQVLS